MLKAIIFDMDGVLIDSNNAWYVVFNKALNYFEKKTILREEFDENVWAKDFNETARKYFNMEAKEIIEFFKKEYSLFEKDVSFYSGVNETLTELKKNGLKLTVATNTNLETANKILKKLGLIGLFDYVIGGDQVREGKPEPDMLLKTLKDMNLKKGEVIFVGDTIWDKIAAEKAGVRFIGMRLEGKEKIERLSELLEIVK